MSRVKNRLKIYGSIKDIITFISDNYEKDIYHPSDGKYPPNYILFFGKSFPTPEDIIDDKNKIYKWRMNNWGTPFLSELEEQISELSIFYKHSYDYTRYKLTSEEDKFNSYTLRKVLEYSEMFYGENIHPNENELITFFNTTMTPPTRLITNWVNMYKYSTLVFKLDYWDMEDRYVGNIHFDYSQNKYILEHYVKEHDLLSYIRYMLERNVKTLDDYVAEITELLILTDKLGSDYKEIEKMVSDEVELKETFEEQVIFITFMISKLNENLMKENPC